MAPTGSFHRDRGGGGFGKAVADGRIAVAGFHDVRYQCLDLEYLAALDLGRHIDQWAGHLDSLHAGGESHNHFRRGGPETAVAHFGDGHHRLGVGEAEAGRDFRFAGARAEMDRDNAVSYTHLTLPTKRIV